MTTLTHDPGRGCTLCPLMRGTPARGNGLCLAKRKGRRPMDGLLLVPTRIAPEWCPLAAGPVLVRRIIMTSTEKLKGV